MTRIIVGLHGNTGAGKDTVADYMCRKHGFRAVAFADALKSDLSAMFDAPVNLFTDRSTKQVPTTCLTLDRCKSDKFVDWFIGTSAGETEAGNMGESMMHLPRSPRWIMQTYGTDYCRSLNSPYWIDRLQHTLAEFDDDAKVVISDVRFVDEAYFVKSESDLNEVWEVIRMNNPHHDKNDRHASNIRLPSVDRVLFNSGTINQLWRKIDRAVEVVL